jgi:AraC-like DNA-binding protein
MTQLSGPVAWLTFPGPYFKFGIQPGKGTWHHRFVSFKGALPDFYAQSGLFPLKTPIIKITDPAKYGETFDKLLALLSCQDTKKSYRAIHLLEELLLLLAEQPAVFHQDTPEREKINALIATINKKPEADIDFEKQAVKAGVSYPHFRRIFKNITGLPPTQFVLQRRLEKAAALLRTGKKNISEIANDCGFYDIYHFAKTFKKYYSIPPAKYRKNHAVN